MRVTASSMAAAPVLKFPFEYLPDLYAPEHTIAELASGQRIPLFKVCYLTRPEGLPFGEYSDTSEGRVAALPSALAKLSTYCRVMALKPASCARYLNELIRFLNWADADALAGHYELVLSDAELALKAIEEYNALLKHLVQTGRLNINTAATRAGFTRTILSLVHGREYADDVEVLAHSGAARTPTVAAELEDVGILLSALAKTFDLCEEIVANPRSGGSRKRTFTVVSAGSEQNFCLRDGVSNWVALDLACLSFAVLAIGDSGSNHSQIAQLEYSDALWDQLSGADIVTMRLKELKFRAGGKEVPVHFTAVVRRRFPAYLRLRERMLEAFPDDALDNLVFLRMKNAAENSGGGLIRVTNIDKLLASLRARFQACFGAPLPKVTLRQLRLHVGNKFTEIAGPKVSADRLGHSLRTAIKNYNLGPASKRNGELTDFFVSVAKSAVAAGRQPGEMLPGEVELATGVCKDRGQPEKLIAAPSNIEPNCRKTEGCLFCDKYRVHADKTDIRKLLSCKFVLNRLALTGGAADEVEAVYGAIMSRIQTLLDELQRRSPAIYEEVAADVLANQNLSPYWAARFSQLCLLGLVSRRGAHEETIAQ
ncbi:hypothetical protein G3A43_09440 [Paraburkholderia aspalathi]|nr:hypothetical protein [Paraburkholderia aspalathi]MBK3779823.1 hypothetical protein [Paraburkholderia aspalathi]MBK3780449.1 hypothetical protein [Paraburkholderia aspalathi]